MSEYHNNTSKITLESQNLFSRYPNIFRLIQINKIIFKFSNVFINARIKNSIAISWNFLNVSKLFLKSVIAQTRFSTIRPRLFQSHEIFDTDFYTNFRFAFFLSILPRCLKFRAPSPSLCLNFSPLKFLSVPLCPTRFVFIGLSVNRTAFEQGVQREQKRAFKRAHTRTLHVLLMHVHRTRLSSGDKRTFSIIPRVYRFSNPVSRNLIAAGVGAESFIVRPPRYN